MLSWQYPWLHRWCFAAEGDTGGGGGDGGGGGTGGAGGDGGDGGGDDGGDDGGTPALTYETWYAALDEAPKALVDTHIAGLKSALGAQTQQRKALAKQLQAASAKLEKGSDARKALEAMTTQLALVEQRAEFYEEAGKPEIGCSDVKLAYLAAMDGKFIDDKGNVDWDRLKKEHPNLFGKPVWPKGDAGTGGGQQGTKKPSMNAWIRAASGRGT